MKADLDRNETMKARAGEGTLLIDPRNPHSLFTPPSKPILIRHDSEFSVNTEYSVGEADVARLNVWQGAALLTADCLGTGLLALPSDVKVLGWTLGLGFLLANLPINFYAGTIFHKVASAVESKQGAENIIYQQSVSGGAIAPFNMRQVDDDSEDEARDYVQLNQNTASSILSILSEINNLV
jgi:hypothetical protein